MWVILSILLLVPLAGLVYLATLDGSFRVRRSLEMQSPIEAAFAAVVDLKTWPEWSPWLMHEPDTELVYSENYRDEGGYYSWDGKIVGAGRLSHETIKPNSSIRQQIEFLRPFKSSSRVNWEFEARDGATLVSWEMEGRMPFLFRFMAKRMEPMISRDYDLGLALLSGYLNSASPHPRIAFVGKQKLDDFSYWSIPSNGNLRQLEASRQPNIDALTAAAGGKSGLPLTLYHGFDPMASDYRAEVAISIGDATPASNYTRREFSGGNYFELSLRGDHRFIPLAWHALSCHCRMHKITVDNSRPALEIYHDDSSTVEDSNQIKTALYLPIR